METKLYYRGAVMFRKTSHSLRRMFMAASPCLLPDRDRRGWNEFRYLVMAENRSKGVSSFLFTTFYSTFHQHIHSLGRGNDFNTI